MPKPLIWFFKIDSFSHINAAVEAQLRLRFPEAEVRTVDVLADLIEREPMRRAAAFSHAGFCYASRILRTRQNPRDFYTRLAWVWRFLNQKAAEMTNDPRTWFTFQTQSLFDAGGKGIAHFVYTDHTLLANRRYAQSSRPLRVSDQWRQLEAELYRKAVCTFTTSRFCTESLMKDYGISGESAPCVYSGSNVIPPESPGVEQRPRTILFVGLEWERKGGPELVEAFRMARQRFDDAELWIVGCKPRINEIGIRELGKVSLEKVRELYGQASVFCLPSIREPSATVLMEAAAFALPVIATNAGGTPDRVIDGETGWLVPVQDVSALAGAMTEALANPDEAKRRGIKGHARYKEHFTWDAVGSKMESIIRSRINQ